MLHYATLLQVVWRHTTAGEGNNFVDCLRQHSVEQISEESAIRTCVPLFDAILESVPDYLGGVTLERAQKLARVAAAS
jgi:hypothetical protein